MTELIAKYQKYVDNIEWHIRTNQPEKEKLTHCNEQLYCYKEILSDLKATQQPTLPGEYYRAVPVEEKLPEIQAWYMCLFSPSSVNLNIVGEAFFNKKTITFTPNSYNDRAVTHWLEPIKITSTREAASRAFEAGESYGMNSLSGRPDEMNKITYLNSLYGTDTK